MCAYGWTVTMLVKILLNRQYPLILPIPILWLWSSGKLHRTQTFPIYSPAVACGKSLTNLIQLKNRLYSSFQIISSFLSSQFRCLQLHLPFRSLWVRKIIFSVLALYFIRCLKTVSENWVRGYLGSFGFTDIISALPFIPCLYVFIN